MKTIKLTLSVLLLTLIGSNASAEVPRDAQRKIRDMEHGAKVVKAKQESKSQQAKKPTKAKKAKKAKKGESKEEAAKSRKSGELKHGKEDTLDRVAPPPRPAHDAEVEVPKKRRSEKTAGAEKAQHDKARPAKGLTHIEKEARKNQWRLARIARLEEIARGQSNERLLNKVTMLRAKEAARHKRAMKRLNSRVDAGVDAGS